jgi:endonuclease/exonuclease/phosphatase family metal-dependent hydrolase
LNAEPLEDSIVTLSSSGLTDLGAASGGGLTFPTDEPAKRIDYVFARRSAAAVSSEATLLGALPTDDSKHLLAPEGERPEYGMLSDTSPLFASDHLGLRVDIL